MSTKQQAESYLRQALGDPKAVFRDGQWESIEQLLNRKRILLVQRAGYGKSMVYFLATKILRELGAGPTLLISPLLSLMRNQLEAAQRIGLTADTINSTKNWRERRKIQDKLVSNKVDVLLISPEQLEMPDFRQKTLVNMTMTKKIGLFVVDEAHCISDWGHDFRRDYLQIVRVLQTMPSDVPVLATTATANDRVVKDVKDQLGKNIIVQRGSLACKSLKLQNINMPSRRARLAWLAKIIPALQGSGIIYTLTQRDAERVARWLKSKNIDAKAYHGDIPARLREELEQQLLNNEIKVLVATVALGMGFDKPDLEFVIHFQCPASVVHYYQQVGRAGRAVDEAYGILLCGPEDDDINDSLIHNAFPSQQNISEILRVLDEFDNGLLASEIQKFLNLPEKQIDKTIKYMANESPSPITKIKSKWQVTATAASYRVNQKYVDAIINIRQKEQQQMRDYMEYTGCLMAFLQDALDDPSPTACGQCRNCRPDLLLDETYENELANQALVHRDYQPLLPKEEWPDENMFIQYPWSESKIPPDQLAEEGRALSLGLDDGLGAFVYYEKYNTNKFADELVAVCVEMLQKWSPNPAPLWVTYIPSLNRPELVADFAENLADELGLDFVACIQKNPAKEEQKDMKNNYHQVRNLDGVFKITDKCLDGSCLLVDDITASGWTFTVASALLRQKGCSAVYPMALALKSKSSRKD